ncbi:hypothetical protein EV702DRAFT_1282555 [Suillus placidus]|uniref:Uncharacterized protein n=1 Tax=Suillus placidus TaxID=48579 RepID=A0A9P6ZKF8_9AGAM|nr:hypothetical protein EV702DRAFT_1282555 [Suillus placidus]
MVNLLMYTVNHYGLCEKVVFADTINTNKKSGALRWDQVEGHIRCMEHTINLAAGHFLMAVSPTSSCKLLKKIKVALQHSELKGKSIDFDALDASLDRIDYEGVDECEDNNDEDDDLGVGDLIGKALVLVKQIRASPQAHTFFAQSCKQADVPVLELTQRHISHMLHGVNLFVKLADDSEDIPSLKGKRYYADFHLNKKDWEKMKLVHKVLQSRENMAALPQFSQVHDTIHKGLNNFAKWYNKAKVPNTYFICLALNPNVKVAYSEHQWDGELFKFDEYYTIPPISAPVDADIEQAPPGQAQYGCSWVLAAVQARQASDCTQLRPHAKLTAYLQSPLEQMEDVVGWWGDLWLQAADVIDRGCKKDAGDSIIDTSEAARGCSREKPEAGGK